MLSTNRPSRVSGRMRSLEHGTRSGAVLRRCSGPLLSATRTSSDRWRRCAGETCSTWRRGMSSRFTSARADELSVLECLWCGATPESRPTAICSCHRQPEAGGASEAESTSIIDGRNVIRRILVKRSVSWCRILDEAVVVNIFR